MKEEKNSQKNKKILMTGASGFLGKRVLSILLDKGMDVLVLGRNKVEGVEFHKFDLVNDKFKEGFFDDIGLILHLAAFVPTNKLQDNFSNLYSNNILATSNLYESSGNIPFIFVSTCEVYGTQKNIPIGENLSPHPESNYALTKYIAESLLYRSSKAKERKITVLRITTLYGENDHIQRAIPNFVKASLKEETLFINGNGLTRRDYLYVKDAANAIINSVLNNKEGVYNISSGEGISIKKLANIIVELTGSNSKIKYNKNENAKDLIFCVEKYKNLYDLNVTPLEQGLKNIIEWQKQQSS